MNRLPLICFLVLVAACAYKQAFTPARFTTIGYALPGAFIYRLQLSGIEGSLIRTDTLGLFCSDHLLRESDGQYEMQWQFLTRSNAGYAIINPDHSSTGIKVSDTELYIHPPRYDCLQELQFLPHPLFEQMDTIGRTWSWDFVIGHYWAIDSLYPIPERETFHIKYAYTGLFPVRTGTGTLPCHKVTAASTSKFGRSGAVYYLNPEYGLIRFSLVSAYGRRYEFDLIEKLSASEAVHCNDLLYRKEEAWKIPYLMQ